MASFPTTCTARHRGITLLEVLIAMFVLAVGILSILALFTAGRELESRAAVKSQAVAFAAAQSTTVGQQWLHWRQWLRSDAGSFRWAKRTTDLNQVTLPVLVDPWGLCAGATISGPAVGPWDPETGTGKWDWTRVVPLESGTATATPFVRVTLPATERTSFLDDSPVIDPFNREGALASFSDEDAIEYQLSANPDDPPLNAFEVGRRKRGSDLVPALFIAPADPSDNTVRDGTLVRRTLLIFHKPVPDFEEDAAPTTDWPAGMVELRVTRYEPGLIVAQVFKTPKDLTAARRSLRPGKFMLFTRRVAGPPYVYDSHWGEIVSFTTDKPDFTGECVVVVKNDLPAGWPSGAGWQVEGADNVKTPMFCYGFEHLVHVVQYPDVNTRLPPN